MRKIYRHLVIAIAAIGMLPVATAGAAQVVQTTAEANATAIPVAASAGGWSWPTLAGALIVVGIVAACIYYIFRERNDK